MKFYILASVILLGFIIFRANKKSEKEVKLQEKNFWDREAAANSTRKQPIDHLPYIQIPMDKLPFEVLTENADVHECMDIIRQLSTQKILNLTGYTNTDLKLAYGTANITPLSAYDQNYTILVRTLQKWADLLLEGGYAEEACTIMEFALDTNTDVSRTYYELARYWSEKGEPIKLCKLLETAENLRSSNKDTIVHTLTESYL